MQLRNVLLVYSKPESRPEEHALRAVKAALQESAVRFTAINRKNMKSSLFRNKDLIVTVGGDGTFLRSAHFLPKGVPILGVNSNPLAKEGHLLAANGKTFPPFLKRLLSGKARVRLHPTLEARVNGRKINLFALNEFFFGSSRAYRTSRYVISRGKRKETHRSSGVIVATPIGAHAWASSALGKRIRVPQDKFSYVVRDPYEKKVFSHYRLKKGILSQKEKLTIISKMRDGVLVADSLSGECPIRHGDRVSFSLSKKKIAAVAA